MKTIFASLLAALTSLLTGCVGVVWQHDTIVRYREPVQVVVGEERVCTYTTTMRPGYCVHRPIVRNGVIVHQWVWRSTSPPPIGEIVVPTDQYNRQYHYYGPSPSPRFYRPRSDIGCIFEEGGCVLQYSNDDFYHFEDLALR